MADATCVLCGAPFRPKRGSGRPRLHCFDCRPAVTKGDRTPCPFRGERNSRREPQFAHVLFPRPSGDRSWCLWCGIAVSQHRGNRRIWCSKSCAHKAWYAGLADVGRVGSRAACADCGSQYTVTGGTQVRCTDCHQATYVSVSEGQPCLQCGGPRERNTISFCVACSSEREKERGRRSNRRRRLARRAAGEAGKYTTAEVAERDGFRCHLCHRKVDMQLSGMAPRGPTIDHLLPLALGGLDELPNVALAHRSCNIRKGATNGPPQQLRLVG